ncbi:serine hydrolase [Candidatus Parcubacteria bacterium]|nr:serine hydrolase [Candidatus Parcubacteria bacterium]
MSELKTLIEQMEHKRKEREWYHIGFGLFAGVLVLGGLSVLVPGVWPQKEVVPVAPLPTAFDNIELSAQAAIVYDLITGEVLYEKNAQAQLPLASLTKLLTLYVAVDALSLKTPIPMTAQAIASEGDNGFIAGEMFTLEDLAKLALVGSSNDAAAAIAEAAAEARHATNGTALLAGAAAALGLSQTYALNGTGLDENDALSGAYGSAHDIAILAGEFLKRAPDIAKASLSASVTATSRNGFSYTLQNTNPEALSIPGLLLSKTGYTDLAGGNLAVVFDAGIAHPIAIVVLGSTKDDRFLDVNTLVRATAAQFAGLTLD